MLHDNQFAMKSIGLCDSGSVIVLLLMQPKRLMLAKVQVQRVRNIHGDSISSSSEEGGLVKGRANYVMLKDWSADALYKEHTALLLQSWV